jgi:RNA-directed DNA polymerase
MMAMVLILGPIFEADLPNEQYGYRPGVSAHDALIAVRNGLCEGYPEVVDADLTAYFDTLPHHELMGSVARRVVDRRILRLIKQWLECAVEETDDRGCKQCTTLNKDTGTGIPQGSPLSPLLANLYMRRFILGWKTCRATRQKDVRIVPYADDLVILCRSGEAETALAEMRNLMERLKLQVNEDKTRTCAISREHFDFLGYSFGRYFSKRTGGAYTGLRPSKKSIHRLIVSLRDLTHRRTTWLETTEQVARINRVLAGWINYFSMGSTSDAYRAIEAYSAMRMRRWLLRKHKSRRNGCREYPGAWLFGPLGLIQPSARHSNLPWAKA